LENSLYQEAFLSAPLGGEKTPGKGWSFAPLLVESRPMKSLIFDFDGLILDTETVGFQVWNEIYASHGQKLLLADWAFCIGTSHHAFDVYANLDKKTGKALPREEIKKQFQTRAMELITRLEPCPGVLDYLRDARRLGLSLAVASSSDRNWVEGHLDRLQLRRFFQVIRTSNDVKQVKPDPELYLSALEALGARPEEALALEDSPNGIRAAQAAGLYCVAVPNSVTIRLDLSHANERLESMEDLSLGKLLERVENARANA
jgi:HAD superfamily hydrolase (TIGR01509 family)